MVEDSITIINGNYSKDGFTIIENEKIKENVSFINYEFKQFEKYFTQDKIKNRNILKRFSDSFKVNHFFSSKSINKILKQHFSFKTPVFCGPVFSHYTANDKTGEGYGLPYHQDYPSMASSKESLIIWFSLKDCNQASHSIAVLKGLHKKGLLPGKQSEHGYEININEDFMNKEEILDIKAGQILFMSSFLPHKTFINPNANFPKMSLSRRIDDFSSEEWRERNYVNAYQHNVDRTLFLT